MNNAFSILIMASCLIFASCFLSKNNTTKQVHSRTLTADDRMLELIAPQGQVASMGLDIEIRNYTSGGTLVVYRKSLQSREHLGSIVLSKYQFLQYDIHRSGDYYGGGIVVEFQPSSQDSVVSLEVEAIFSCIKTCTPSHDH